MKAVGSLEYGGQLVFNELPTPTIARDEILVKIISTSVNHLDLVEASGTLRQILPIDLPWIPGHEFSGVVEQIGSDVKACAPGDAAFGTTSGNGRIRGVCGCQGGGRRKETIQPLSPLRRRHQCRWPSKLQGTEFSPMVTWKIDKRS